MEARVCKTCQQLLPIDNFYAYGDNGKYRRGTCKPCTSHKNNTYYHEHKPVSDTPPKRGRKKKYDVPNVAASTSSLSKEDIKTLEIYEEFGSCTKLVFGI